MSTVAPIGKRVRRARTRLGMSQGDLADASGLSRVFVSNVERGEQEPGAQSAARLAEALGVSVGALFGTPELRVYSAVELATLLLDCDDDSEIVLWALPSAAGVRRDGMG